MKAEFRSKVSQILWAALLITLPFTSFPLVANLFGGTSVAPLSAVFMGLLILAVFLPQFTKTRSFPKEFAPLILFFAFAVISVGLSFFYEVPSFRSTPPFKNSLEGLVTLLLGIGFYLVTITLVKTEDDLQKSLRWINLGALIIFASSAAQAASWLFRGGYPDWMMEIQSVLTSSGILYRQRVTGVAYEPSWLAHQLNMLYLPLWLGLSIKRQSAYKIRILHRFTVENVLLGLGLITLFLSFSRIGWLTTIFVIAFIIINQLNKYSNRILARREAKKSSQLSGSRRFLFKLFFWVAFLLLFVSGVLLIGLLLSKIDPRMGQLFDFERFRQFGIIGWASQLMFAERLIYWITGYNVFVKFPILGSGLGTSGYYFPEVVPSIGYKFPEIIRAINLETFIPNAKNLWVRLLAETGIVGLSLFVAWIYGHWKDASKLDAVNRNGISSAFSLIGHLMIVALFFEGFSMDTFGLPYLWVGFGLIVAIMRFGSQIVALGDSEKLERNLTTVEPE